MSFKELRASSGLTLKQFASYFEIPYKTAQKWDREERNCTGYLLKLMEYKLQNEGIVKKEN